MIQKLTKIIRDFRHSAKVGKAHAHYRKRRFSQSQAFLNQVLDNKPSIDTRALALELVGKLKYHEGRYVEAIEALESSNAAIDLIVEMSVSSNPTISALMRSNQELIKSAKFKLDVSNNAST